jgi:hypothetical protein
VFWVSLSIADIIAEPDKKVKPVAEKEEGITVR